MLFLQLVLFQDLLVLVRLVHFEVREEFATLRDLAEQTLATGLIFPMILQVTRQETDLLGKEGDLNLRAAGVFGVLAVLGDQIFLCGALEDHKGKRGKT